MRLTFVVDVAVIAAVPSATAVTKPVASTVATALFELEGVVSLFMVDDFVTVTKSSGVSWDKLVPEVQAVIERVLG